jgi:hypothetical protein
MWPLLRSWDFCLANSSSVTGERITVRLSAPVYASRAYPAIFARETRPVLLPQRHVYFIRKLISSLPPEVSAKAIPKRRNAITKQNFQILSLGSVCVAHAQQRNDRSGQNTMHKWP